MLTSFFKKLAGGKFLFLIIGICLSLSSKVNAQEIEWQNTIGSDQFDWLTCLQKTSDNGFIIAGFTPGGVTGDKSEPNCYPQSPSNSSEFWILKLDSFGNIQWQNNIGGWNSETSPHIEETTDGGFICGGSSNSYISCDKNENNIGISGQDYWILKLDSLGNIQWQNTIGGSEQDILQSISQTQSGGYILGGHSSSDISGDKTENATLNGFNDYWIVNVDSIGNIVWQNTIGGNGYDNLFSVHQTSDSGYILGGYSAAGISGDKTEASNGVDYWVVKIDSLGNIQWQNTIGGSGLDYLYDLEPTSDGGYICGGVSNSPISYDKTEDSLGGNDFWILKLDSAGNIIWQNTIGGVGDEIFSSIIETNDGSYSIMGASNSKISGDKIENNWDQDSTDYDYWILKLNSLGDIIWQNTIGGNDVDDPYFFGSKLVQLGNDGNLICGGSSMSGIYGDKSSYCRGSLDYWVIKLTDQYNLITGKTFADLNSNSTQDIGEPSLPNQTITEASTNRFGFTQPNGFYSVSVLDTGNFSVSPSPINYYSAVPVSHAATFTGINQTDSLNDFAFQPLGTFNDLCVTLTPLGAFRPGFNASYMINYENVGTTTLSPTVTLYQNNLLSYVSSSVAPTVTSTDSIQWSGLPVLSPFQSGSILVTLNVSAAAVIGSNIYSQCVIEPMVNDYNVYCNYSGVSSIITGGVDPNDIIVNEDTLTTTQLAAQPFLDYTIRFQNTGNDTAFTAKIINPIDTNKLELNSIEFVNSSHPVQLKWVNYNRNMEFLLENILLPDSGVNEPQSHGFVTYRIKPKTSLIAGDSVTNKGYLYFDFNTPVETNTAVTKIILPTGLTPNPSPGERGVLQCFPNPAKNELNIQLHPSNHPNYLNPSINISIYDVFGKKILSQQSKTSKFKLQTSNLSNGIYFVEVKTGNEVYRGKFVKE